MFPPPFSFIYPTPLLYDRVLRGTNKKHRLTRGSFFFCFFGIRLSEMYLKLNGDKVIFCYNDKVLAVSDTM